MHLRELDAPPAHYTAQQDGAGMWFFTTPTGQSSGMLTRSQAEHLADVTEKQDAEKLAKNPNPA